MENHLINMEDKKRIIITEVKDIEAFDEDAILVNLADDGIVIKGENLNIEKLDLNEGKLIAVGKINAISYTGKKHAKKDKKENIIARLRNRAGHR